MRPAASDASLQQLVREHAALRRVATLVAREPSPAEVFEAVAREVGTLLGARRAQLVRGSDLGGLIDRVEAVGGRLDIRSPSGQGTRLSARLPTNVLGGLNGG